MRDTYEDYACHDSDTTKQKEFRRRPSTSRLPCDDDGNGDTTPTGDTGDNKSRTSSAAAHRRRRKSVKSITGSRSKRRIRDNGEKPCSKALLALSNNSSGRSACKTKTTVKMANICGGAHLHGGGSLQVRADGVVSMSRFPRGDCGTYRKSCGDGEVSTSNNDRRGGWGRKGIEKAAHGTFQHGFVGCLRNPGGGRRR